MSETQHIQGDSILQEAIIGLHSPDPSAAMLNVDLPMERTILSESRLCIGPCRGQAIDAADSRKAAESELRNLLGGIFEQAGRAGMTMHNSLVSPADEARFTGAGMSVKLDKPHSAYYHWVHLSGEWQVHALGEAGRFHAVFIGKEISEKEAILPDGTVSENISPEVLKAIHQLCPHLRIEEMKALTDIPRNVWLGAWDNGKLHLRIGVRQWVQDELSIETKYFAGARINWTAE